MNDLSNEPPDIATVVWQADELLDRRRTAAARALLAEGLARAPDHPDLLLALARADYNDDLLADARQALAQCLRARPQDPDARLLLHLVAAQEGEGQEAESLILDLLREQPDDARYYALYARLMLQYLHLDKAEALTEEALRLAPASPLVLRSRALCELARGRHGRDNEALVRLIADDPQDQHTLRMVLIALCERGRLRQARQLAADLLRLQPDDPALLALAKATRYQAHWSLWPLWPMARFGWAGSIGLWVLCVLGQRVVRAQWGPDAAALFVAVVLVYVVYSWVWPPLLRKMMGVTA